MTRNVQVIYASDDLFPIKKFTYNRKAFLDGRPVLLRLAECGQFALKGF